MMTISVDPSVTTTLSLMRPVSVLDSDSKDQMHELAPYHQTGVDIYIRQQCTQIYWLVTTFCDDGFAEQTLDWKCTCPSSNNF